MDCRRTPSITASPSWVIVEEGGPELAELLENEGYERFAEVPA